MPRTLLVLRHATTEADAPGGDFARRLTPEGEREASDVGSAVAATDHVPTLILHSTAVRAVRTTELLVSGGGATLQGVPAQGIDELYLAPPRAILTALERLAGDHEVVMVVAHNPGLSDLCQLLMRSADDSALVPLGRGMRPATLVRIRFDALTWSGLLNRGHVEACRHPS